MTVYLDSTLVIRQLVGTKTLGRRGAWDAAYASALMRTGVIAPPTCCVSPGNWMMSNARGSALDRAGLQKRHDRTGHRRRAATRGRRLSTAVGTVQAIHLATLLELKSVHDITCLVATADDELLRAAESMGFSDALKAPLKSIPSQHRRNRLPRSQRRKRPRRRIKTTPRRRGERSLLCCEPLRGRNKRG